jgi:hypothetical protein
MARCLGFAGLGLIAALLGAAPALADACKPLAKLTTVDLIAARGVYLIPVTINGTPQKLLLATAGGISTINQSAATALGLNPVDTPFAPRLVNGAAKSSNAYISVQNFGLGEMRAQNLFFAIAPNLQAGANPDFSYDGALAPDLMFRNDVELDFAAGKLSYFSQDHCEGHVVYWPNSGIAVVPFQTSRNGRVGSRQDSHIRVPVMIDGRPFLATIATGEPRSTMTAKEAQYQFNVTSDQPGRGDTDTRAFSHVFGNLSFGGVGGVNVANPQMLIVPNLVGNRLTNVLGPGGERATRYDNPDLVAQVTIGMDVLKKLHIYIAFAERKLYITAAAAPQNGAADNAPAALR